MAATRRLQKELADLRTAGLKTFRDIQARNKNYKMHLKVPPN